jgi:hypothetical protein
MKNYQKEIRNENSMARTWIFMPWTGNSRSGAADSADSSVLYGNIILLCKKLTEAA